MDKPRSTAAPIIAALLLLVPVLYVGSYLALVKPGQNPIVGNRIYQSSYRYGGMKSQRIYWPLEQVDRKVRPRAWFNPFDDEPFSP